MNTITIIKAINIIKESDISFMERRIVFQVDFFLFQNRMKGFHGSVIKRTALFTVRKSEAHPLSSRNILRRSILTATVAVKNNIIVIVLILLDTDSEISGYTPNIKVKCQQNEINRSMDNPEIDEGTDFRQRTIEHNNNKDRSPAAEKYGKP